MLVVDLEYQWKWLADTAGRSNLLESEVKRDFDGSGMKK
jgi:hypothetical protein